MTIYDVIVIGVGGVGSAALYHAARRGARALGLDRFPPGHDRGSSHGQTRMIRQAYFEHSDYVPMLRRAYTLWHELELACGRPLFFPVGLVEVGPADGIVIPGVLASARRFGLDVETLTPAEVASRFPGFLVPEGSSAVFEAQAGYLLVEDCVLAHIEQASQRGAEVVIGEQVVGWRKTAGEFVVETDRHHYRADRLIITAGPWAGQLLADCRVPLRVVRKHLHWFANDDSRYRADRGCPAFFYETADGYFYGFPQIDDHGLKVAEHSGGVTVDDPLLDPRSLDTADRARVVRFLQAHLPGVSDVATRHDVCFYTMSPDDHFLVDRHPDHPSLAFAAGLSGHGFKFATVLGEALTDLVFEGDTSAPIGFLGLNRSSGPTF